MALNNLAQRIDHGLLVAMRSYLHGSRTEAVVKAYSELGEYGMIWSTLALGAAVGDRPRRAKWVKAAAVPPASLALNWVAKKAVGRPRPKLRGKPPLTRTHSQLSFPSAHATMAFSSGHVISTLQPSVRKPVFIAALAMAATRPYLGMHYPSDVVAGALFGSLTGIALERFVTVSKP